MGPGRTLVKDQLKDEQMLITCGPLGASWKIDIEGRLVEYIGRPVYVKVEGQQVQEAELLMGLHKGCTGHIGSSNRNRLAILRAG